MLRILFTGGGTGGHIYPFVSVAEEIKKMSAEKNLDVSMYYCGNPGIYGAIIESAGITIKKTIAVKIRRYFDIRNFLTPFMFCLSILEFLYKMLFLMPDVVFSKGGPGSLQVVLVAWFYRIPVIIHESDSVPGLSNTIAARFSKRIAISFKSTQEYFSGAVALTGNPIRSEFLKPAMDKKSAKTSLGLNPELPVLLFIGGSLRATRNNDFVLDVLPLLLKEFQILHQTGINNIDDVKMEFNIIAKNLNAEEKNRYKAVPYFERNLSEALAAADIVISRAGSGGIFEIAGMTKPSILIPLPEAAQEHQRKNAYEYAATGAAIVIEGDNLTPNVFVSQIKNLLANSEKMKAMSEAAKNFFKPEAARIIAEEIIKLGLRS